MANLRQTHLMRARGHAVFFALQLLTLLTLLLSSATVRATTGAAPDVATLEQLAVGKVLPVELVSRWESEAQRQQTLRGMRSDAKLLVVHLWASWCSPCIEEFPVLKQMFPDGRLGEAQLVLIAVQSPPDALRAFLDKYSAILPRTTHYRDDNGALQTALHLAKLPLTLLVDRGWVVRQAFFGPVTKRRAELLTSIDRYLNPPLLSAVSGSYLSCAKAPCIEPAFFLHGSLLLKQTRRWVQRAQALVATSMLLPLDGQPNLIYLMTPKCTSCLADLPLLQKVAQRWHRGKGGQAKFVLLVASADPGWLTRLMQEHEELGDVVILHSAMPKLTQLMESQGTAVTLIMNRQGYVRNAFVGLYKDHQGAVTDVLFQAVQER